MSDDVEHLRRYAEDGSETAFAEFVRRHLGLVYGAALRRLGGDAHGAADVAQHVFVMAARDARRLAKHPGLAGWLYTTTRNAALDRMKAERRRRHWETAAHAEHERLFVTRAEAAPLATADWAAVRPVLDEAMDELPPADREAVLLRFFEARSFAEVGERLRLTENAARMRVERALDKLHAGLARRGVSSTAAALGTALASEAAASAAAVPVGLAASVTGSALTAAAGVVPLAGIFAIMSTTKIVVGVAAVVAVAGVGTGIYQAREARLTRTELAAVQAERETVRRLADATAARLQAAETELALREQRIAALQSDAQKRTAGAGRGTTAVVAAAAAAASATPSAVNPGFERMANPEYARLSMQKLKAEIGLRYGPLYRMLGLGPEQIAKFEANRVAYEQATMDVWSTAVAQGVSVHDPAVVKLASEAGGALERELTEMLGRDGHQEFAKYRSARTALDFLSGLAGNLCYTDAPLTRAQGEKLIQLAVDNTRTVPSPTKPNVRQWVTDWTALEAGAQGILAGPQLTAFKAMIEARNLQQQMGTWMAGKSEGTAAAAPKR